MTQMQQRPRKIAHGNPPTLESITTKARRLPNRVILHAVEGWGKTSFGAMTPSPVFIMTGKETGLWTLMEAGQLPDNIPHFPKPVEYWPDLKLAVHELLLKEHSHKTLVIDTMNGAERLCHEHVCETQFGGDWGEKGFSAFQKGYDVAVPAWLDFLALLDQLREKGMSILLLTHTKVKNFKNPQGPDYDRYQPAVHEKTWEVTHRWADMVLFGLFEVIVEKTNKSKSDAETKGKAKGGQTRLIYTVRHAAYDAKNRHGLPEEIECGDSPQEAWQNFVEALKAGKEQK